MTELNEEQTFQLIAQIVSGVRRHTGDPDALVTVLTEINRLTNQWQTSGAPTSDTSKVMFALNPSTTGWAAAGIDPVEVTAWEMLGFTPEYAQRWSNAKLNLTHALKWSTIHNITSFEPSVISEWEQSGAAVDDVSTIAMWLRSSVPTQRAIAWKLAGGGFYDGKDWLREFPDVDPADLYTTSTLQLTKSQVKPWVKQNIVGEPLKVFLSKGYTPAAARKYLDGGGTMDALPDKRGDAPVPGRSWKRIAAAIKDNPNITSTVKETHSFLRCELTLKGNEHPVEIDFRKNGQFADGTIYKAVTYHSFRGTTSTTMRAHRVNLAQLMEFLADWK